MEFDFGEIILEEELYFGELELDVVKQYPSLIDLEVIPSTKEQIFNHEGSYGYDEVRVKAVTGETLNIVPSKEEQKFNGVYTEVNVDGLITSELNVVPTKETQNYEGLYEKINVQAVTSDIDENITPENIKQGIKMLGVIGTFTGGKYKPRVTELTFKNYEGTELDYETQNLDTSFFTSMSEMFYYCRYLTHLDVSGFNTSNVTNMNGMFYQCQNLTSLDLSNFDFSKVTNIQEMFRNCRYLKHLDIRTLTFDNITSYGWAFQFYKTSNDIEIIVKSETEKQWFATNYSGYSNVKTVAEYENS